MSSRGFIIMNEWGEYFAGLMYGQIIFSRDEKEVKPLYDLHKFEMLKFYLNTENLIYEFIN
jgi:hypothetical protein